MADVHGTPETPQNLPPDVGQPQGPANIPPIVDPLGRETDRNACMWAMFCHLAGFAGLLPVVPGIGCLLGPLVVWLVKKNEFPFVEEQGKEALNFQITMFIYGVAAGLLMLLCVGVLLLVVVGIVDVVLIIMAAIKVNDGYHYRYPYPLIIRFIKQPTILFFVTALLCFRQHLPLWAALSASLAVWLLGAVVHQVVLRKS